MPARKPCPTDVSNEEWSLVVLCLVLMRGNGEQRRHDLRELFNGLRYVIRYGIAWRARPNDPPSWSVVYQQSRRWMGEAASKRWCPICVPCCVSPLVAGRSQRQPFSTAGRYVRRRKVVLVPDTMGPNAKRDQSCTWPWTHWGTCWPSMSHQPVGMTAPMWDALLPPFRRPLTKTSSWPMLIRDIQVQNQTRRPARTGSRLKSSSFRNQVRLCPAAASMGRRTIFRMGHAMPQARQGLRALRFNTRKSPCHCVSCSETPLQSLKVRNTL